MDVHEQERTKLRELQAVFEQAVQQNSINDMKPHIDTDFSYVSFTDRSFKDFDAFSQQWSKTRSEMVGNGSFSTNLEPEPALFYDDIAVCFGNSKNNMIDKHGKAFDFDSHWTVICKRNDGQWKVVRAHNSLNPFSNPMLVAAVKAKLLSFSLMAFIAGGIVCSVVTFLLMR